MLRIILSAVLQNYHLMEIQIDNPTGTYSRREKERDQSFFISDKAAIVQEQFG